MNVLASLAAEPQLAALFLDIDGVLAPIAPRREEAAVAEPVRQELRRLARRYRLVACITGRPRVDAERIVAVPELTYVGEHGLELDPEAASFTAAIAAFADETDWPETERKLHSVALHFRRAAQPGEARRELESIARSAREHGLRARFGRMVLEILPPVDTTKGTAVTLLLAGSGVRRALYAGDDTTDLDGFRALDGLEVAVRIAVASPESPAELLSRADLIVDSPQAFAALLETL